MCTLQTCPSAAAPAVADVPGASAAARQTNAQVKARELIMIFVDFVFIVVVSFCLSFVVLAFRDFSSLSCHFRPFTEVLRKI
jgi:heme/copper-type cytochrome/quinol oxidase subunit 2